MFLNPSEKQNSSGSKVSTRFQLNETASQVSSLLCITPSGHVTMAMTFVPPFLGGGS